VTDFSAAARPDAARVSLAAEPDAAFLAGLRDTPVDLRADRTCDWLIAHVRLFLRVDPGERVGPESGFLELGFDSLLAVDFKLLLERKLACALRSTVVFDCPTPAALSRVLERELRPLEASSSAAFTASPVAPVAPGEPIAIVGMACRFPGGARDPDEYWQFLLSGRDAITEIPAARWDLAEWYDADRSSPGKMYVRHGGFLGEVERFDAAFFGITPREAMELDPQQRLLLETAWEALERAGIAPDSLSGQPVAFYLGTRGSDYFVRCSPRQREVIGTYNAAGNALSTAAGRVSYTLGFTGPCFALDTACSSSLVALHQAVAALRDGECTLALAAGVNLILDPIGTVSTCKAGMLSPGGRCRAFSAQADGYVRSEGVGMLVLEPLASALRAGRRPLALVRGSAINQDGASGGLTVPSGAAQVAVLRLALQRGGVDPASVAHVEAHGTGTALGDPIEVRALQEVYGAAPGRTRKLSIGSVKTNIGHCETAAGMAGVIAAVQALRQRELPAILHCETRSPHIDWNAIAVEPLLARTPFHGELGEPRRIGVSSFGFSGTNGHVVLEEAPALEAVAAATRPSELVPLSASTPTALAESARRLLVRLEADPAVSLADAAYTLGVGRAALRERCALHARDSADWRAQLAALAADPSSARRGRGTVGTRAPRIAFVYTGQGAQRSGMGRELGTHLPVFRAALAECSAALAPHLGCAIEDLMYGERSAELARTEWTQPALFALEYALTRTWEALGCSPCWVLGHSVGEYAAAVAAGVYTLSEAAELIAARGRLMRELAPEGAMIAVHAAHERVAELVVRHALAVDLAADNAPDLCTWSGAHAPIAALERLLAEAGLRAQRLDVSHAFHSRVLEPMLGAFEQRLRGTQPRVARIGFISNVTGAPAGQELCDPRRWVEHVRGTVRFAAGARCLFAQAIDGVIEIGPAPVLSGLLRRCAPDSRVPLIASQRAQGGEWEALLDAVARVWSLGTRIDWSILHGGRGARCVELPTYPFERERHWLEIPSGAPAPAAPGGSAGPLGLERATSLLADGDALYESHFSEDQPAWISGHRVFGSVLAPAALYVAQALAAGARTWPGSGLRIEGLAIRRALELDAAPTTVEVHVQNGSNGVSFRIASRSSGSAGAWREHATGRCRALAAGTPARTDLDALRARCPEPIDVAAHFREFEALGLEYAGPFRALEAAWSGPGQVLSRIAVPPDDGWIVHPAAIDLCLQSCRALMPDAARGKTYLPVAFDAFEWNAHPGGVLCAHARLLGGPDGSATEAPRRVSVSIDLYAEDGRRVGGIEGLQLVRADPRALRRASQRIERVLYEVAWVPAPRKSESGSATGPWILVGAAAQLSSRLAAALERAGGTAIAIDPIRGAAAAEIGASVAAARSNLRGIVYLQDHEPLGSIEDAVARATACFQAYANEDPAPAARAFLVTRHACDVLPTTYCLDLAGAALGGWFASVSRERPAWRGVQLDLERYVHDGELDALVAELCAADPSGHARETRVAWRHGERHVARLRDPRERKARVVPAAESHALRCDGNGTLDGLTLIARPRSTPGPGEVELEIDACGLNFKDVLYALGRLGDFARSKGITAARDWPLGMEACGRVARVGAGVDDIRIGERVWCIGTGLAARHALVLRSQVARAPQGLTAAQAAAQPVAWLTVLWALERLAKLQAGETLLVHGAAGGVGHAAIQHAKRVGARVIASAGRSKHAYLRALGVEAVVDSRAVDYAAELRAAAGERGIDVVLSGLGGGVVAAGLALLRERGRYVELGKLDVWSAGQVASARPDAEYHVFDLELELARDLAWMRASLERLAAEIDVSVTWPVETHAIDVRHAHEAFDALARRRSIGKYALTFGASAESVRADATYVVTGGLGGLGLATAGWLIEAGARWLCLLGRGAPRHEVEQRLESWRARGVRVEARQGDVADAGELRLALTLEPEWPEVDTVFHAAGVLRDATLAAIDPTSIEEVLRPKLGGAQALRNDPVTRNARIVYFTSAAGVLGSAGQAVYAAANAALDSLATNEAARGLRCRAIAYGPWAEVGMAARLGERERLHIAALGIVPLAPEFALDASAHVLASGPTTALVVDIDWGKWSSVGAGADEALTSEVLRKRDPAGMAAGDATGRPERQRGDVRRALAAAADDERGERLCVWLAAEVAAVTGLGATARIDATRRFVEYGIDSLQSVELRNRIEHGLDAALPATLLFDHPTLAELTAHLSTTLDAATAEAPISSSDASGEIDIELLAAIESLSEDEARGRSGAELADG
jgi:acyl transferase domain-containing protein/acyl carrier protein